MSQQLMQRFLSECGSRGPIQLIAQNPATGDTLRRSLEQPFAIIGRNSKADVPLEDEEVSHRHAYLQVYDGRVFCIDLKSRTGTHWDDGPQEYGWLEGKQPIRVGSYRIKLLDGGPPTPTLPHPPLYLPSTPGGDTEAVGEGREGREPLVSRRLKNLALGGVSLEFMPRHGDTEVDEPLARWKTQRVLALVGRAATCKVRLVHPSVSRIHCSLVRTPLGLWVVDLLGRKGTLVNGAPISWALLEDGDQLQIGRFVIRVHYDHSPTLTLSHPTLDLSPESGGDPEGGEGEGREGDLRGRAGDTPAEDVDDETLEMDPPSNIVLFAASAKQPSEPEASPPSSPPPTLAQGRVGASGGDPERGGGSRIEDRRSTDTPYSIPGENEQGQSAPLVVPALAGKEDPLKAELQTISETPSSILDPSSSDPDMTREADPVPEPGPPPFPVRRASRPSHRGQGTGGGALVRSSSRAPTKAEWMEMILPAITDQFAQMQQQMFDQFQQAMIMMFRTFGQLHREQMDMVRQELDRIHQLTQQLHALQMELAKHPAAASDPTVQEMLAALAPVSKPRIEDGGSKIERPNEPGDSRSSILDPQFLSLPPDDAWETALAKAAGQWESTEDQSSEKGDFSSEQEEAPLPNDTESGIGTGKDTAPEEQQPALVSATADSDNDAGPPTPTLPHAGGEGREGGAAPKSDQPSQSLRDKPAQAKTTPDIHVLLCRQIAALQEERQTRWQRILSFLTGKGSREPVP